MRDSEFPITAAMGLSVLNASDIDPTQDEIIDYIVDLLDELQDLAGRLERSSDGRYSLLL